MTETIRLTNSTCPNLEPYDTPIQDKVDKFTSSVKDAAVNDSIVVGCPEDGCKLAFELYVADGNYGKIARNGIFGKVCMRQSQKP